MDKAGKRYGISRTAGVVISLAAISVAAVVLVPVVVFFPSTAGDVVGVLVASLIIPVIAVFRPLQEFVVLPDGLGFGTVFSKRVYEVAWADVTDVRLRRRFGIANMEVGEAGKRLYKKVPLSVVPERQAFLRELLRRFPADHPRRASLETAIDSYLGRH